jgi:hypothetical protein
MSSTAASSGTQRAALSASKIAKADTATTKHAVRLQTQQHTLMYVSNKVEKL